MRRVLYVALLLAAACKPHGDVPQGLEAGVDAGPLGLANPANDPALVALTPPLESCHFSDQLGLSGYTCAARDAIVEAAHRSPTGLATMLNWLEDPSERVRGAAVEAISGNFKGHFEPAAFKPCTDGDRVKAALDRETIPALRQNLVYGWYSYVERCRADDSKLQAFLRDDGPETLVPARHYLADRLSPEMVERPGWHDAMLAVARNEKAPAEVRAAVVGALFKSKQDDGVLETLRGLVRAKGDLAAPAASSLAMLRDDSSFGDILDATRADLAAGGKHFGLMQALHRYVRREGAAIDHPGVVAVAEGAVATSSLPNESRQAALDILESEHRPSSRKVLEKLGASKDPADKMLAPRAAAIVGAWPKK